MFICNLIIAVYLCNRLVVLFLKISQKMFWIIRLVWRIFLKGILILGHDLAGIIYRFTSILINEIRGIKLLLNEIDYRKFIRLKPLPLTDFSKKVKKKSFFRKEKLCNFNF
jgi:hypothetical protein